MIWFYTGQVRVNWKIAWLAMFVALALGMSGCSGINTGTTVSPASFFLPGIMRNDPPAENTPIISGEVSFSTQLAVVR